MPLILCIPCVSNPVTEVNFLIIRIGDLMDWLKVDIMAINMLVHQNAFHDNVRDLVLIHFWSFVVVYVFFLYERLEFFEQLQRRQALRNSIIALALKSFEATNSLIETAYIYSSGISDVLMTAGCQMQLRWCPQEVLDFMPILSYTLYKKMFAQIICLSRIYVRNIYGSCRCLLLIQFRKCLSIIWCRMYL